MAASPLPTRPPPRLRLTASTGKVCRSEGRGQVTCEGEEKTQHCTLSNGRRASRTVTPPARHRLLAESEARCPTSSRNQDWYARKSRPLETGRPLKPGTRLDLGRRVYVTSLDLCS